MTRLSVLLGFVQKIDFSIIDVINLSAGWKKLLDNKFWKQGNLPGEIYLTKIPKLSWETNLSLILLTIQLIENLHIIKY